MKHRHIDIQRQLSGPVVVSNDIIESLFGNFKHLFECRPQADMNGTVFLIPALCGRPDAATLSNALVHARHGDLATWEREQNLYAMRKTRQAFFADNRSQDAGNP